MTDRPVSGGGKAGKPPAQAERLTREAAALRANLLKRKDQARQREAAKDDESKPLPRPPAPE